VELKKIVIFVMCLTQRECQPSHSKADRRESGDGKRFGLDRYPPQLDRLSYRTLRFFGGFYKHPEKLKVKKQNTLMVITREGDTVIKEQLESNDFTKITRGNIIIYII
jgi:hypothetical protein